ncbi:MAG: flippase [Candidatus Liptonbacteria bacterium]|nr:flippase [Candidatus Liptonbacteria bacterium]
MIKKVKDFLLVNRTTRQTVAKNTFWLTVSNLGGRLIKAGIIIYSARILGAAEWGLFSYVVSFAVLITIFTDLGIGPILTREASRTDDPVKKSQIISTAFFLKLALLAVGILVVIFVAPHFTTIKEARPLFPIVALIIVFDTLQNFGFSMTRALEKMELEATFYLLTNMAIVVFGFLTLHFYPTVKFFAYAYAAGIGIGAFATLFYLRKYLGNLFSYFQKKLIKPILGAAWPFAISGLLGVLMINTDILLIGYFLAAEKVGIYSAADRPIQLLYLLPAILATSVFPTFSRLANRDSEKMKRVLEKILSLASLISIPIALGGIVLGGDIIRIVFGSAYTQAVPSFRILVATLSINFTASILTNAIFAYNRQKDLIKFTALGGITNVILDLILIPRFGIVGSAWATLLAQVIGNFYIWNKMRQINSFSVLPKIKKVVLAAIIMALAVFGMHRLGVNLFINLGLGVGIYFLLLYAMKESLLKEFKLILRGGASDEPENSGSVVL